MIIAITISVMMMMMMMIIIITIMITIIITTTIITIITIITHCDARRQLLDDPHLSALLWGQRSSPDLHTRRLEKMPVE